MQRGPHAHENSDGEEEAGNETNHEDEVEECENPQNHSSNLPSASELRAINEARNLYKSNTYKAQASIFLLSYFPFISFCSFVARLVTSKRSPRRVLHSAP